MYIQDLEFAKALTLAHGTATFALHAAACELRVFPTRGTFAGVESTDECNGILTLAIAAMIAAEGAQDICVTYGKVKTQLAASKY